MRFRTHPFIWTTWLVFVSCLFSTAVHAQQKVWVDDFIITVHDEASADSRELGHLLKGEELDLVVTRGKWAQVEAFRGLLTGWVPEEQLRFTRPARRFRSDRVETKDYGDLVSPAYPGTSMMGKAMDASPPHRGPYRGADYCMECHKSGKPGVPGGGRPSDVWRQSYHARAYETLRTAKAKAVGRRYGIASPHLDGRCLKCHVTGYGAENGAADAIKKMEGVGCETCHGPGNSSFGSGSPFDVKNLKRREQLCTGCHNELSPTWNGFNLEVFSRAIAHWRPRTEALKKHTESKAQGKPKQPSWYNQQAKKKSHDSGSAPRQSNSGDGAGLIVLHDGTAGPVHFPHGKHQTELGLSCNDCHHVPGQFKCRSCHTPGSTVTRHAVFHTGGKTACQNCHREKKKDGWNGPLRCTGCHQEAADSATGRAASKIASITKPLPPRHLVPIAPKKPKRVEKASHPEPASKGGAGPKNIVLHDGGMFPVKFAHHTHQSSYGIECSTCHHVPGNFKCRACHTSKTKVSRRDAFHMAGRQACQTCHQDVKKGGGRAPMKCNGCHKPG